VILHSRCEILDIPVDVDQALRLTLPDLATSPRATIQVHATERQLGFILFVSFYHNPRLTMASPKMQHFYRDTSPIAEHYINYVYIPATFIISITALTKIEWTPYAVAISLVLAGYGVYSNRTRTYSRPANSFTDTSTEAKKVLKPDEFQEYPLGEKQVLSHNTAIYRFKLPTENSILGLPIGQHISLAATLDVTNPKTGVTAPAEVVRSYTPVSSDQESGYFDLLIKAYPTGNISKHVASLEIGDMLKVRGPKGAMVYKPNMVKRIGMIAGGTGITPMLQISRAIYRGRRAAGDKTQVDLIFANVNDQDILLREELDKLAREDKGFRVYYVLNNPPTGWTGGVGFVTADMIKVSFGRKSVVGGSGFTNACAGTPSASEQGYQDADLWPAAYGQCYEEGD